MNAHQLAWWLSGFPKPQGIRFLRVFPKDSRVCIYVEPEAFVDPNLDAKIWQWIARAFLPPTDCDRITICLID